LRLDHIDGLFDPKNYLERLQAAILLEWAAEEIGQDGKLNDEQKEMVLAWREAEKRKNYRGLSSRPLYVVAEKILSGGENLPEKWALHGTSGYDFLNDLNGLFIDSNNEEQLKKIYSRFTGIQDPFSNIVYRSKKNIMWTDMASELNVLAYTLNRISEKNRRSRDFTLNSLRDALAEVVACFFKYRTYINASGWTESDQETIKTAITWARRRNPVMESSIFDFIYDILLSKRTDGLSDEEYRRRLDFTMKFQQYTSPLQAKGVEDTAFYRYNMLASLNEVGGEPQRFGRSLAEFHESNLRRLQQWPYGMLATATHDTKRGEDVRARLNILSEIPDEWSWQLSKWELLNAANRSVIDEEPAPDRNDEYLFYQTLIGIWPNVEELREQLIERLRAFMIKATREAKVHTSWINENKAYEDAVCNYIEKTLNGPDSEGFISSFQNFQKRIAQLGMVNSLSQVVLKITSPGVPDFYQGSELWDLSLVDPDNRRPVDYKRRKELLESMETPLNKPTPPAERLALIAEMLKNWEDGRIKLFTTARGLRLRRKYPELFLNGDYLPLYAEREFENHIVAFARRHDNQLIMTIVPRLITNLTDQEHPLPIGGESWKTARIFLPAYFGKRTFFNLFTGEQVRPIIHGGHTGIFVAEALRTCPVSILVAE